MPIRPFLTQAQAPLTHTVNVINQAGELSTVSIPAERALTLYVDKHELVTLMTLGAQPELLVLGFLRNQRLLQNLAEVVSITVDWDVGAAAVKTRNGIANLATKTAKRVVTTGCGQGSVFGDLMAEVDALNLPPSHITQSQIYAITEAIRQQESTYKSAGSVHGCALFSVSQISADKNAYTVEMSIFVEDVGRHNAIDTIAGWMWLQDSAWHQNRTFVFYTTGRLTSEMIIKSAQMGIPIVLSRSGMTQMGHAIATRLGLCTIGRAVNKHFICYSGQERLIFEL